MSGELGPKTKTYFVPPPTDGINLVSAPAQYKDSEAREIKNYWVFDTGIRQMPEAVNTVQNSGANSNCQLLTSYTSIAIYASMLKLYKLTSATSNAPVDITGGATITLAAWNPCFFNKRLFIFNGTDTPLYHDFGAGNFTPFTATGPTVATLKQGCGYKSRMYLVQGSSTTYWYGDVDAFAGTFKPIDLATILSLPNSSILCAFPWTFNQGLNNEEMLVFLTSQGEVLIYSGDYPGAPNWGLVGRSFIPIPSGAAVAYSGQPFYKMANDTYIATTRGLIPMSTVFAGQAIQDGYYNLSRKIKNQIVDAFGGLISVDRNSPFLYVISGSATNQLFVMNYETGAWSVYTPTIANGEAIISTGFFGKYLMIATGLPNGTSGGIYYVDIATGTASSTLTYSWKTPFFNFVSTSQALSSISGIQKHIKNLRVMGTNVNNDSTFKVTASCAADFVDPTTPAQSTASKAVTSGSTVVAEIAPPGIGRWIGFNFSRAGVNSINECNEIQGIEVVYEEGGAI